MAMENILIETEQAKITLINPDHLDVITAFFHISNTKALKWIEEKIHLQKSKGLNCFSAFLKETGAYIGYCDCTEVELKNQTEIQLNWQIQKRFKEDEIDIEIAFAVRNYLFKYYDIMSLFAVILNTDLDNITVAEAIDMEPEYSIYQDNQEWLVYVVRRNFPKFLASYGDGESSVLSSTLRRNENSPNPLKNFKRPRPRPK